MAATTGKPNILVIWGDDIGISNLSCYTHGLMGYQTPNIDRLAQEGMMFTDSYGERTVPFASRRLTNSTMESRVIRAIFSRYRSWVSLAESSVPRTLTLDPGFDSVVMGHRLPACGT